MLYGSGGGANSIASTNLLVAVQGMEWRQGVPGKEARRALTAELEGLNVDPAEARRFVKYLSDEARQREANGDTSALPLGAKTAKLASALHPLRDVR
eukprot:5165090-Amphidinium_carterae.1